MIVLLGGGRVGNLLGEEFRSLHLPAKEADLGEDSLPLASALPPIKEGAGVPPLPYTSLHQNPSPSRRPPQVAAALGFSLAAELGLSPSPSRRPILLPWCL